VKRAHDGIAAQAPSILVLPHGYITDIAIAPSNSSVGYADHHSQYDTADGRVYKTTDRGLTWTLVSASSLPSNLHILRLMVDEEDEDVLYLLAGEGRFTCGPAVLYESADGSVTWTPIATGLGQIADTAQAPGDPNTLYISTYGDVWDAGYRCIQDDPDGGYIYRAHFDGSWSWEPITDESNLGNRNLLLWPDAGDPQTLRAIDLDYPEVWETTDGGATRRASGVPLAAETLGQRPLLRRLRSRLLGRPLQRRWRTDVGAPQRRAGVALRQPDPGGPHPPVRPLARFPRDRLLPTPHPSRSAHPQTAPAVGAPTGMGRPVRPPPLELLSALPLETSEV